MTEPTNSSAHTNLRAGRPLHVPEDDTTFRLAQLLLLLDTLAQQSQPGINLERLSYYDFLVANPMLMITDDNDPDRTRLVMAGFDGRALSYASPTQRFTNRRERLQHDLAILISYSLAMPHVEGKVTYGVTPAGHELASQFTAVYAAAYRLSAEIVIRRLTRLSDRRLRENAREWISMSPESSRPEVIDLLFAINTSAAEGEDDPAETLGTNSSSKAPTTTND
ncbi:hypothetical protein AAHS21_26880 [Mycobacterium sp. 050272]|uniref:hypothetical protein n=1 Tax=Mycobacterium sp. 050272 TaxID=3142488 RepID=UPI0031871892